MQTAVRVLTNSEEKSPAQTAVRGFTPSNLCRYGCGSVFSIVEGHDDIKDQIDMMHAIDDTEIVAGDPRVDSVEHVHELCLDLRDTRVTDSDRIAVNGQEHAEPGEDLPLRPVDDRVRLLEAHRVRDLRVDRCDRAARPVAVHDEVVGADDAVRTVDDVRDLLRENCIFRLSDQRLDRLLRDGEAAEHDKCRHDEAGDSVDMDGKKMLDKDDGDGHGCDDAVIARICGRSGQEL